MSYTAHLWLFFVLVFGAVLLPGLDFAFILGSALTGGRRHGFSAIAGAVTGAACHSVFAAIGIGLVLKVFPAAFAILLFAGTFYIAWLGIGIFRSSSTTATTESNAPMSPWKTFRRATANNLMNPNAYLFSLAIFPQFIVPSYGPIALQALVLWLIIAATQAIVYGAEVLAAASVRHWMIAKPNAETFIRRIVGGMLIAAAVVTAIGGWNRL
jgi:threonine/homoserine/homoserine lactone efflux protein